MDRAVRRDKILAVVSVSQSVALRINEDDHEDDYDEEELRQSDACEHTGESLIFCLVAAHQTEQPQDQQNHGNGIQHGLSPRASSSPHEDGASWRGYSARKPNGPGEILRCGAVSGRRMNV